MHREGDFAVLVGNRSPVGYYDLRTDPTMQHNLLETDPAAAAAAQPMVVAVRQSSVRPVTREANAGARTIEALQALGYVDRDPEDATAEP